MATDLQTLLDAGATAVSGDLRDRASLDAACQGVETVLTTANSILRGGDIEGVDFQGTINLMEAAQAASVRHFIYTSAAGVDPQHPNPLFSAKGRCEQNLKQGDMAYTILAPGIFAEVWVGTVVGIPLQAQQPVTLLGQGTTKNAFVSMADVAAYGVMAVDNAAARNQTIHIGGDRDYSWNDVVGVVGRVVGQELPVNYVPIGDPVPLIPEDMVPLMAALETAGSHIEMRQTASKYGIPPTPLQTAVQRMFG